VRGLLEAHGLLPVHDGELPCVSRAVAGEVVKGSWWGHANGKEIFHVLVALDDETVTAKLVGGKLTLVHERLWPALAAVGRSGEPWQREGLRADAQALLAAVEQAGTLRTDRASLATGTRKIGAVADDLERRLLVAAVQVHTESGKHARALSTWKHFLRERGLRAGDLPRPAAGRVALAAPIERWVGPAHAAKLVPW
jgi:hypothetical protein